MFQKKIKIQHAHFLAFRGQDSDRWLLQQTSFHVKFLLLFGRLFINYRSTLWSLCIWNYCKIYKQCTQVVFFSFRVQASQEHLWQSPIIIAYMYMKKKSWFYFSSANSSIAGLSFVVNLRGEHKATY